MQKLIFVNKDGLYDVIFDSRKPEAEKFQNWVYHEVLPSIRKTGVYVNDKAYLKWLETRQHGTDTLKLETGVIKQFVKYARAQGYTWNERYIYSTITIWCNVGAGIPKKNGRNNADIHQLNTLALLEGTVVQNVLIDEMADGLHYTQTWAKVKQKIRLFCELTGRELPKLKFQG